MPADRVWSLHGLAFGDCGKGLACDALVRRLGARLVVRFNGGAQAGHTVVEPGGRRHTFSSFGAGSLVAGVPTLLAAPVVVHPTGLVEEARALAAIGVGDALERLFVDGRCLVTTPFHQAAGRLREWRRHDQHGSCGLGFGETIRHALGDPASALRWRDLTRPAAAKAKLDAIRRALRADLAAAGIAEPAAADIVRTIARPPARADFARVRASSPAMAADLAQASASSPSMRAELAQPSVSSPSMRAELALLDDGFGERAGERWLVAACEAARRVPPRSVDEVGRLLSHAGTVVFEGAQGVLLDEDHGFHPHTTWSRTGTAAVGAVLADADPPRERRALGVLRSYLTRHGAGPLPTEDDGLDALAEPDNRDDGWQGRFRRGHADAVLLRYALDVVGPLDALFVTHLDAFADGRVSLRWCERYADGAGPDGGAGGRLAVVPGGDLRARADLTARLRAAAPVYDERPPADADGFVARLRATAGLPIAFGAYGPTHRDVVSVDGEPRPVRRPAA